MAHANDSSAPHKFSPPIATLLALTFTGIDPADVARGGRLFAIEILAALAGAFARLHAAAAGAPVALTPADADAVGALVARCLATVASLADDERAGRVFLSAPSTSDHGAAVLRGLAEALLKSGTIGNVAEEWRAMASEPQAVRDFLDAAESAAWQAREHWLSRQALDVATTIAGRE